MATQSAPARATADPTEHNGRDRRVTTPGLRAGPTEDPGPLQAAHTPNFPALLRHLGASLAVPGFLDGGLAPWEQQPVELPQRLLGRA